MQHAVHCVESTSPARAASAFPVPPSRRPAISITLAPWVLRSGVELVSDILSHLAVSMVV